MLTVIQSFLFAFSANIDNIAIGISYGIKNIKIPFKVNSIISIFVAIITFLVMYISRYISNFFEIKIINKIGAYLLIILGSYYIIKDLIYKKKKSDNLSKLSLKNIIILSITLATNNVSVGILASMININYFLTLIFTFILSFLMLIFGNRLGRKMINNKIEKYSNIISSLVLILLGILQLF